MLSNADGYSSLVAMFYFEVIGFAREARALSSVTSDRTMLTASFMRYLHGFRIIQKNAMYLLTSFRKNSFDVCGIPEPTQVVGDQMLAITSLASYDYNPCQCKAVSTRLKDLNET